MAQGESHIEKIARIDANVKALMQALPIVHELNKDSAVNKREHRIAISLVGLIVLPMIAWICHALGIALL